MALSGETSVEVNVLSVDGVIPEFIRIAGLLDAAMAHDITADVSAEFQATMMEIAEFSAPFEFIPDFDEMSDSLLQRFGRVSVTASINRFVADREIEIASVAVGELCSRFHRDLNGVEISVDTLSGESEQIEIVRRVPTGYGTYTSERVNRVEGYGYVAHPREKAITLLPETKRFTRKNKRNGIAHYVVHLLDDTNKPLVELH